MPFRPGLKGVAPGQLLKTTRCDELRKRCANRRCRLIVHSKHEDPGVQSGGRALSVAKAPVEGDHESFDCGGRRGRGGVISAGEVFVFGRANVVTG